MTRTAVVRGAGGFIGNHLVSAFKADGFHVRGVDLKYPEFSDTQADEPLIADLRDQDFATKAVDARFDDVHQIAAHVSKAQNRAGL